MQKNQNYSLALKYLKECKFSVIPVKQDKKPYISWQEYQKRLPTEQELLQWWTQWPDANVAIVTGIISGIAVIDLDELDIAKKALGELISDSLVFPVVKTPSGGEHWYFTCVDSKLSNNARAVAGADLRANGGFVVAPPSINGNRKHWRWQDDKLTPFKIPLPYLPESYIKHVFTVNVYTDKHVFKEKEEEEDIKNKTNSLSEGSCNEHTESRGVTFQSGTRDNDLFHVATCLLKGNMTQQNAMKVLEMLAEKCTPPFPLDELKNKLFSAEKRQERIYQVITSELESLQVITEGAFSITDCYNSLQSITIITSHYKDTIVTQKNNPLRNAIAQILYRWKKEGKIKSYGDKAGWYIKVQNQTDEIDWWNAEVEKLPIQYPFGIEEYVTTYPKNIITIAGEMNAGKTTFCLNFAKLNLNNKMKMPIIYCSSEMGRAELKMRLSKFTDIQLPEWRKITFVERAVGFADIINPDGINIIDYMELTDNFYKIAEYTKEIFDKLKTGICLIAIQKDKKAEYGRGGTFGLEKPRLYLNMGHGQIKIVKAKVWAESGVNPNGLVYNFKIVNGAELKERFANGVVGWQRLKKDEIYY